MNKQNVLIQTVSLSEQVYIKLKKAILEGEFPPGHRLLVLEIANKFEISQAPVREALERLKQEGLIVGKTNKGSVVSEITSKEIKDVYEFRTLVEGHAIREAMKVMHAGDFEYLEHTVQGMREAIKEKDAFQLVELDMRFHGFFYERCNNHLFVEIWKNIRTKIMRFISITNQHVPNDDIVAGHSKLLEVIKSGNVEEAATMGVEGFQFYKDYTG
ncbi:GntR family transcriptional regulator [Paenibacillus alkaliterrae]|uniref:GntR family transcriptional regulator n=1 Tax=Paenibacillus alkaliterrae TaxID=320909 RepID=UPI001F3D73B3|nr:GntR family transcriptional regulator [Paenibacillus alkaliterrae]MCF2938712.1 GntR family transcriptional regulator [Paenibacillus alkaliterrae]